MQKQATIIRWDTTRGFGFMRSTHTRADVFFNIRDWVADGEQPSDGLQVFYEEVEIGGRAPRLAVRPVEYTGRGRAASSAKSRGVTVAGLGVSGRLLALGALVLMAVGGAGVFAFRSGYF